MGLCRTDAEAGEQCEIEIFHGIRQIRDSWDRLVPSGDPYWASAFLENIEKHPPGDYRFRYLLFRKKGRPVGVAYAQITLFSAWQSIRGGLGETGRRRSFFTIFRHWLARKLELNTLILGNTLVSGQYAYHFDETVTDPAAEVRRATEQLIAALEGEGIPIHVVTVKDLGSEQAGAWQTGPHEWKEVCFQPRMLVHLRKDWRSGDDYVASMNSKYRVRYRRARKKLAPILSRRMSLAEMQESRATMHRLYSEVAKQSGFNMVKLQEDYWCELKEVFGDNFTVRGYFKGEELVGFYSLLRGEHAVWHANFLGYDQAANHQHQLYLNMLYDMVTSAIEGQAEVLDFSRTALEIKSSVGAEPENLYCYFRHRSRFINPMVPWLAQVIAPDDAWEQRHPFKA